jgi:uncharacterized membrane protein YfcA
MHLIALAIIIGAMAALLGSLLGVGGGIIMVPAFKAMGLTMQQAIGTSLAVMVVTAAVSSLKYAHSGFIHWGIAGAAAAAAVVAAYFGTELMKTLSAQQLKSGFGIFLIVVGVYMLFFQKAAAS